MPESLLTRKRGTDPRKTQRTYLQGLREKRLAAARKADRKAFDAFFEATYQRLFLS